MRYMKKSQDDLVDPATGQTPLAKNKLTELTQKNNPTNLTQLQLTIMATKPDLRSYSKLTNTDRMTTFKNQMPYQSPMVSIKIF